MPDPACGSNSLNRRDLFRSAGAIAAGGLLLNEVFAQENNPGANVGDRTSSIRISALKATPVGPKVYVRIEVRDLAGNTEHAETSKPVFIDLARPTAQIVDIEPNVSPQQ